MTPFHTAVADRRVVTGWLANPKYLLCGLYGVCLSVLELQVSVKQRRLTVTFNGQTLQSMHLDSPSGEWGNRDSPHCLEMCEVSIVL